MRTRIVVAILSILIAYVAVFFGSGLREFWNVASQGDFVILPIVIFVILASAVGALLWIASMECIIDKSSDETSIYAAAGALILLSAVFGLLAQPFALSPFPWKWISLWDIVLVLAMAPLTLELVLPKPAR